jgi:hypothetical protein
VKEWDLPATLDDRQSARAATLVQINPTAPIASRAVLRRDAIRFLRGLKQERSWWRTAPRAEGINR